MPVTIERHQGALDSKVFCKGCNQGLGKIIYDYPSAGNVSEKLAEELEGFAIRHTRRHPAHNVEVILYENTNHGRS